MLGLLLLYWVGKYFYKLAEDNDKNLWGFTILGIVTYISATIIFGFRFGLIVWLVSPGYFEDFNETVLGLLFIPFGLLTSYLLYLYLEKTGIKIN